VIEVREVLRGWLSGVGLRVVAAHAGVDRKTARRYIAAAQEAGLTREDRCSDHGGVTGKRTMTPTRRSSGTRPK
jgi:predicted DNA-binding transcriptional regulator YafY